MTSPVDTSPNALAKLLLGIISADRDIMIRIDKYVFGEHDDPYMPLGADAEYKLLAKRSVSNWIPLLINTPAQALYVDDFRRGDSFGSDGANTGKPLPEWKHWQDSRLDARQLAIHRGALKYGHSFALTEKNAAGKVETIGLSAFNTAAVYVDPANDIDPYAALTITQYPDPGSDTMPKKIGRARMWDLTTSYDVTFQSLDDLKSVRVSVRGLHGLTECPVTRFAASVDLEGRTTGVVLPNIDLQNRINQTTFDLLVAQTYGSFKVRTVTGMAPPMKRWSQKMIDGDIDIGITPPEGTEPGDPIIDPETGKPIPEPVNLNARRFFFAEDEKAQFGTLDATQLDGYIESLDMSIRHLAAVTQTPPHYLLGQIANLSADALKASETSLLRKVEEYRKSFGESWERVFRIAGVLSGDAGMASDMAGEVIWRDTEMQSLSATADALVKLKEIGIPLEGLMQRVPEATRGEILKWIEGRQRDLEFRKQLAEIELIANQRIQIPQGQQPPTPSQVDAGSAQSSAVSA